jgi:hypothetical protein
MFYSQRWSPTRDLPACIKRPAVTFVNHECTINVTQLFRRLRIPFTVFVPRADPEPNPPPPPPKSVTLTYKKVGRPRVKSLIIILILESRDYATCSTREERWIYVK